MVGAWGYFLYQGVVDPLGGINSLWPLFGISNQLLAAIALVGGDDADHQVGTRALRMDDAAAADLAAVGDAHRRIPEDLQPGCPHRIPGACHCSCRRASPPARSPAPSSPRRRPLIFNDRLDAAVTGVFMVLVVVIVADSVREWYRVLSAGRGEASWRRG